MKMLVPPPSGDFFLETLTPFILNWWPSSYACDCTVPPQSSTLCFKWLFIYLCAAIILRPFLFAVTLRVLEAARAAVLPPSCGCSINAYKTLYLLQYIIVFSASKAQKQGEAGRVWLGLGVGQHSGQIWSLLLKSGQI